MKFAANNITWGQREGCKICTPGLNDWHCFCKVSNSYVCNFSCHHKEGSKCYHIIITHLCWILCSDIECYYCVLNIDCRWAIIHLHQPFMLSIRTGPFGRNSPSPANSVASIFRSYHMALLILSLPRLATTTHGRKLQLQFTTLLLESFGLIRCDQKPLLKFMSVLLIYWLAIHV